MANALVVVVQSLAMLLAGANLSLAINWASLVVQLIKNLPATWETGV